MASIRLVIPIQRDLDDEANDDDDDGGGSGGKQLTCDLYI